ncbi:MAG: TolC family protein [Desulfobacterales bacterium]|nr:TolC family protein [Desulfobacterales bacterium]
MNRKICFVLCIFLMGTAPAHAGYRALKSDFDSYRPTGYFQDQFRSAGMQAIPAENDPAFAAQKQQLEDMKSRWQKALTAAPEDSVFFRPRPEVSIPLQGAERDASLAANALGDSFSLATLEALTLLRNPGIMAAENNFRSALEAFTQVAALDEILRQYSAYTEGLMPGVGPMKGRDPVAMKFPFPGVLSLKGQIVNQEVIAQRETLEAARRDAVTAARVTFWNLIYVLRSREITSEILQEFRHLEAVADTKYQTGKASYQDVIKVRINRQKLAENLTTLRERQQILYARIREILNLAPDVKIGKPAALEPGRRIPAVRMLDETARKHRQELRRLRARVEKMVYMIEMAETMILPPFTLNLSLFEDEAVSMAGSFSKKDAFPVKTEAERGAGLPRMPTYGIEDAYLRETRQKLRALRAELQKAEAGTHAMVQEAWFELDRARRETLLYGNQIVKLSLSALDVSRRGYESGNAAFADVFDAYSTWLQANLALQRNLSDLGVAWAKLEQVTGSSPGR